MGKGGNQGEGATELEAPMPTFRWEEIQKHNLRTDKWLVIDRKVYNITKWSSRHPGGQRVIGHYAGEDATVRAWGLSRHPSPLQEGGRSRGPRASDKTSSAEWSLARGGGGRPGGKEKCLRRSPPAPNPGPVAQLGQRAGWSDFGARRQIRAVEIRAGSIARAWTLASVPSEFIRSPRLPQSGAPGPWDFGAPSVEDGRPWAPRRGTGEEPGVGLGARPPLCGQTRGRGRKGRPRPGLAPAGIPVSDCPQWLPRRPRLVAAVPTLSETSETPSSPPQRAFLKGTEEAVLIETGRKKKG